jgi:predicted dithiol-disulfide oxidoreductase (DUF899 family)
MSLPDIVSRDEWLAARKALLLREKQLTRQRDAVNADRRRLPMVRVGKDYRFEGPRGTSTLADLFGGKRQLIIQHVMYDPAWDKACPNCTSTLAELAPETVSKLRDNNTAFAAVSRAAYEKIEAYRAERDWDFPWYSSYGSDFNYDFHVSLDASVAPVEYNYRNASELDQAGLNWINSKPMELHGVSCFLRVEDDVFHTYSTYGRGAELAGGIFGLIDLTALGRQEAWEEPKTRVGA